MSQKGQKIAQVALKMLTSAVLVLLMNRLMVLVVRKTDGFYGEICPEWKKDKQKLETLF